MLAQTSRFLGGFGLFVLATFQCLATLPPDACPPPSPLPAGPSAITVNATTFTAYTTAGKAFTVDFWRDACAGTSANSILYLRIGAGGQCDRFTITQSGMQYDGYQYPGCASIVSVPVTNLVEFDYRDPSWLNGGAVTLTLKNISFQSQGSLPAYTGGGGGATVSPRAGLWWNPDESGSGYNLDLRHGVLVVLFYSYAANGDPLWYISSGPLIGNTFTGSLDKFRAGQCISCLYAGMPQATGSDGTVTIQFQSDTSATMTLPGGRVTQIQPEVF